MENPMMQELRQHFINPWAGTGALTVAGMVLVAALLFFWVYYRINNSRLYLYVASLLAFQSAFFALTFRNPFPHAIVVFLEALQVLCLLVLATTIFFVALVRQLIKFGVEDSYFYYKNTGAIKLEILGGSTMLLIIALWLFFKGEGPFLFLNRALGGLSGHGEGMCWLVLLLVLPLVSLAAREFIPLKDTEEGDLLGGGGRLLEFENIFEITGLAGKMEMFTAGLALIVAYGALLFLGATKKDPLDWFGMIVLIAISFSIFRKEATRGQKTELPEELRNRKSIWTK